MAQGLRNCLFLAEVGYSGVTLQPGNSGCWDAQPSPDSAVPLWRDLQS